MKPAPIPADLPPSKLALYMLGRELLAAVDAAIHEELSEGWWACQRAKEEGS